MALVATYLCEVDEEKINNMSYNFFEDVVGMLGKRVHYDAVVNYAGNSFMEKSWDLISEANPFHKKPEKLTGMEAVAAAFNSGTLNIRRG